MASNLKTALLKLTNYQSTDKPSYIDYNADMSLLDAAVGSGWIPFPTTLTYPTTYYDSSADSLGTAYTITLNTGINLSAVLQLGDRFKYTVNGVVTYGILVAVTTSTITLFLKRGTVAPNNVKPITNIYYSHAKSPVGFSVNPIDWTLRVSTSTLLLQSSPSANTFYNIGGNLSVLIGAWKLGWKAPMNPSRSSAGAVEQQCGLSTSLTSFSNLRLVASCYNAAVINILTHASVEDYVITTSKTLYYMLFVTTQTGITQISFCNNGNYGDYTAYAVCAYL